MMSTIDSETMKSFSARAQEAFLAHIYATLTQLTQQTGDFTILFTKTE